MARCEQGYLCSVCGEEVEDLRESDLYLRFLLGEVDPETLHVQPERHILCNPTLAQFIRAADFPTPTVEGPFSRRQLDPEFVAEEESRVTAAYLRLHDLFASSRETPISDYPEPSARRRWLDAP